MSSLGTLEFTTSSSPEPSSPSSQISSTSIPLSNSSLLQQQASIKPPRSPTDPRSSNLDIHNLELLASILSLAKGKLEINSNLHTFNTQPRFQPTQPTRPTPVGTLQSNHILHERWCDECHKPFYGVDCESHQSVCGTEKLFDGASPQDITPTSSFLVTPHAEVIPDVSNADHSTPPKSVLTSANASVIIQQFGTSGCPPTCSIILNGRHSNPSVDRCVPSSSPPSCSHAFASIDIQGPSNFEGGSNFYDDHAQKVNRCHRHCQVSLLRSDSDSSSPHASEDSDDDRTSSSRARHQQSSSSSPSPSGIRSNPKPQQMTPVRNISSSPPRKLKAPLVPLNSRFLNEPDWPHSETYYFEDGTVVFRVRMLLYKVHRHFFDRYSTFFHDLFSTINLDGRDVDDPIFLAEIEPHDFDCLLSIFYPRSFDRPDLTTAEWTSILSLSTRWSFGDIRQSAINHLAPKGTLTAVERIVLGTKFGVKEWLAPAYEEVCLRARPLDLEEGARLGSERVAKIYKLRLELGVEMGMGIGSEGEPCGGGEAGARVPDDASARIKQAFGLDLI